jgi:DNA (cytosine-5)-methyltransferase 1
LKLRLKDMLEDEVDVSFYLSDIQLQQLQGHNIDAQELSIANPINSMEYDGFKELSPTLKARDYKDPKWVAEQNKKIRKLTPRETWRLMGFDNSDFDKASAIHSNSTLYKQAGNSIVVNVLEHILKGLFYESDTV